MHKREIKTGILILVIIPKLLSNIAITTMAVTLKINKGATSLMRFLNTTIIPLIMKNNNKYHGRVSERANAWRKFLICQGKGPNNVYIMDFKKPNGLFSETKEESNPTVETGGVAGVTGTVETGRVGRGTGT